MPFGNTVNPLFLAAAMSTRTFASLLLPLFAVACLVVAYLTGHELRAGMVNADGLYLPTLFDDLLRHGGRFSTWYLTPVPYFFPDYPMFLAAYWLGPDAYLQIVIFSALQCVLLLSAIYLFARTLRIEAALPCAAFSLTLLAWLALSAREPFVLLLWNGWHFGGFIVTLLALAAWQRFADGGGYRALGLACALAFLTTLSDSLFLLQAAVPLACAASARMLLERDYLAGRRLRLALPWMPAAAALLGHMSYKVVVPHATRYSAQMDLHHLAANLHDLHAIALQLWNALPLAVLCWLALFVIALACAVRLALRRDPFGLPRPLAWLLVFWLISLAGQVAVSLLVHNLPMAARYFIPAACWPILLAPMMAAHLLRGRAPALLLAGTLACAVGTGVATLRQWQAHPIERAYYPEDVACVDRALVGTGLRYGIAQYWDAKLFQGFSHQGIVLAQHLESLEELPWITTTRYFRPAYDFALIGPKAPPPHYIPPEKLVAINGQPAAQVRCGSYTLMLYGQDKLKVTRGAVAARWKP